MKVEKVANEILKESLTQLSLNDITTALKKLSKLDERGLKEALINGGITRQYAMKMKILSMPTFSHFYFAQEPGVAAVYKNFKGYDPSSESEEDALASNVYIKWHGGNKFYADF